MENQATNPAIDNGDLMELSPMRMPCSILKPSQKDNLIMLQTPVQKNLKVSFLTPKRTPMRDLAGLKNIASGMSGFIKNQLSKTDVDDDESVIPKITSKLIREEIPCLRKSSTTTSDTSKDKPSLLHSLSSTAPYSATADSKWEILRKLDEKSRWRDRVEVITRLDHEEYQKFANEVISELISKVVDISEARAFCHKEAEVTCIGLTKKDASNISGSILDSQSKFDTPKTKAMGPIDGEFQVGSTILTPSSEKQEIPTLVTSTIDLLANKDIIQFDSNKTCPIKDISKITDQNVTVMKETVTATDEGRHAKDTSPQSPNSSATVPQQDMEKLRFDFDPLSVKEVAGSKCQPPTAKISVDTVFSCTGTGIDKKPTPQYAMRPIDSVFGDNDFVDSGKLLDQGLLDLDYLENKTSGTISSSLKKESLYVKFDPLLEGLGNRHSIALLGRKSDIIDFSGATPVVGDGPTPTEREPDLLCDSPSRGDVTGTIPDTKPRSSSSKTDSTSSTISMDHTHDKLADGIIEMLKYSEQDLHNALRRREEKWSKTRAASCFRIKALEEKIKNQKIILKDMMDRTSNEAERLAKEKVQLEEHQRYLKDVEQVINSGKKRLSEKIGNLFRKNERLENSISNHTAYEEKLKEHANAMREKQASSEAKIKELEESTAEAIKKINSEKLSVESEFANQMNKLKVMMKTTELRVENLQTELDRKQKEKIELLKICDSLVASNEAQSAM